MSNMIKKIQYAVELELASPLCISSGADDYTDSDVQKNAAGEPFIPGTSFAGAIRGYLTELDEPSDVDKLFGYSQGEDGSMSRVQISDFYFIDTPQISVRDGVALENKLAKKGSKYDMEIIETGVKCRGYLLLNVRQGDDEDEYDKMLKLSLKAMNDGDVRLGANKNRGYGQIKVTKVHSKSYDKSNIKEWLKLDRETMFDDAASIVDINDYKASQDRYVTIKVPLRLKGGISIRRYSVKPNEPDYEHISCNDKAVIPGTSWNGAIRSRVATILKELGVNSKLCIDEWFGYVDIDNKKSDNKNSDSKSSDEKDARQSAVIIEESVIQGGQYIAMTRNSVNRFDGSARTGALYTEKTNVGGSTNLIIKVRKNYYDKDAKLHKDDQSKYESIVGMLLIVAKDIQQGYLAVGGQTAVGRGIFEKAGDIELIGAGGKDESYFINAIGAIKGVR